MAQKRITKRISKRNENITADKVVAELTLGFWVRLFNAEYELVLWKPLRMAFPCLEKPQRLYIPELLTP